MRPVIGISSYGRDGEQIPFFSLPCGYVDAVRAAGATPLVLPPGEARPGRLLDLIDGLILSGGGDIAPTAYGGRDHETIYLVSEERDRFELALARAALRRRTLPLLCICRGLQVLNVERGGSLHAHLPDRFGDRVTHRRPPRLPAQHAVRIDAGSRLERIVGAKRLTVCSWHHQSIDRLGRALRPVAWSADGVIEAVEHEQHPWCIGVQWHPELQLRQRAQQRLFEAFVATASNSRRSAVGSRQSPSRHPGRSRRRAARPRRNTS